MKTINVSRAEGPVLDWLVWSIKHANAKTVDELAAALHPKYSPTTDWSQGGPIIEQEGIGLLFDSGSACRKPSWFATPDDQSTTTSYEGESFDPAFMVDEEVGVRGSTPLIAAMRCFVASKLGEIVEVPQELT